MISGIVTLIALLSFLGVAVWAYSQRNRERFDEASRLPLSDDGDTHADIGKQDKAQSQELPPCCRGEHP